jgi:hypothetical protein
MLVCIPWGLPLYYCAFYQNLSDVGAYDPFIQRGTFEKQMRGIIPTLKQTEHWEAVAK